MNINEKAVAENEYEYYLLLMLYAFKLILL
jgi:hypothetical protein